MASFRKNVAVDFSENVLVQVDDDGTCIVVEIDGRSTDLYIEEAQKLRKALKRAIQIAQANADE